MAVVTMTQTVGVFSSGQTYQVRARNAEAFIAASQATKSPVRAATANVPVTKTGK